MYDNILYPTDGSEGATGAFERVRDLAETTGATVHLLYAVDTTQPGLGIAGDPQESTAAGMVGTAKGETAGMTGFRHRVKKIRDMEWEQGEQNLEATAEKLAGIDTTTAVDSGTPHEVILGYADEHGIDLIVMGTHGRTGLDRYLLGSVTEKIVRMADQPVMTVRASN